MIKVNLELEIIPRRYWGYEQAFATDYICRIDGQSQRSDDVNGFIVESLHRKFCEAFKLNLGNKQTFSVFCNTHTLGELYFTFHDNNMYVGTGIRPYHGNTLSNGHAPNT